MDTLTITCTNCMTPISTEATFCASCGHRLKSTPPAVAARPAVAAPPVVVPAPAPVAPVPPPAVSQPSTTAAPAADHRAAASPTAEQGLALPALRPGTLAVLGGAVLAVVASLLNWGDDGVSSDAGFSTPLQFALDGKYYVDANVTIGLFVTVISVIVAAAAIVRPSRVVAALGGVAVGGITALFLSEISTMVGDMQDAGYDVSMTDLVGPGPWLALAAGAAMIVGAAMTGRPRDSRKVPVWFAVALVAAAIGMGAASAEELPDGATADLAQPDDRAQGPGTRGDDGAPRRAETGNPDGDTGSAAELQDTRRELNRLCHRAYLAQENLDNEVGVFTPDQMREHADILANLMVDFSTVRPEGGEALALYDGAFALVRTDMERVFVAAEQAETDYDEAVVSMLQDIHASGPAYVELGLGDCVHRWGR